MPLRGMSISAAQCRAGRAILALTQEELAVASGVSKRTIASFESEQRGPIAANLAMIKTALEAAGVEFIAENGGGPGVRLRKPAAG